MRVFLLPVLCLCLLGCSGPADPGRVCTLIGCESGLEVLLERRPGEPYRIEVEVPGHPARYIVDCADPGRCGDRVFFPSFTPDQVRIHLIAPGLMVTRVAQPVYEEVRPNGPDCPPACRIGRVRLSLP